MKFLVNLARGKQAEVELMDERAERGIVKTGFVKNITEDMSEREMAVKTGGLTKHSIDQFWGGPYGGGIGPNSISVSPADVGSHLWNGAKNVGNTMWNAPGKAYGFMKGLFTPKPLVNDGNVGPVNFDNDAGKSTIERYENKKKIENTPKGSWLGRFTGTSDMKAGLGQMGTAFRRSTNINNTANAAAEKIKRMSEIAGNAGGATNRMMNLAAKANGTGVTGTLKTVWDNKNKFMPGLKTFGKGLGKAGLITGGTMMAGKMFRGFSKPYQPPAQYMSPQQPMQPYYNQPMYMPQRPAQPMQPRGYYNQGRYYG